MGSGYAANYADVIEDKTVKKFCPKEYEALEKALDEVGFCFEDFAQKVAYNAIDEKDVLESKALDALDTLKEAFCIETGLGLELGYHDRGDNGDRYDDVDGFYWSLDGVFQMTPEAKKIEQYINRKFFVTFG